MRLKIFLTGMALLFAQVAQAEISITSSPTKDKGDVQILYLGDGLTRIYDPAAGFVCYSNGRSISCSDIHDSTRRKIERLKDDN